MASLVGNNVPQFYEEDSPQIMDPLTDLEARTEDETILNQPSRKKRGRPPKATKEPRPQSTPKQTTEKTAASRFNRPRATETAAIRDSNPEPDGEHETRNMAPGSNEVVAGAKRKPKKTDDWSERMDQIIQSIDEKLEQMPARWNQTANRQEKLKTTLKVRLDNIEAVSDHELTELPGRLNETDARLLGVNIRKEAREDGIMPQKDPYNIFQKSFLGKLSKIRISENEKNPMATLKEVERRLQDVKDENIELKFVERVVEGSAKHWFEIKARNVTNWAEFRTLYKNTYWNPYVQKKVRDQIESGRYNKDSESTHLNYAYDLIARAEYLEPKIPEAMLVSRLIKHFGDMFYECANFRRIETVEKFIKLIQRFEKKGMWNKPLKRKPNTGSWGFKSYRRNLDGNWRDKTDNKSQEDWKRSQTQVTGKDRMDLGKSNRPDNHKKDQIRALIIDEETEIEEEESATALTQTETSENKLGLEE